MKVAKKILIADDHAIYREGLKQVITKTVDMVVADEATNGLEVLCKIRENDFDIVLLDISMPGRSGLEILAEIKSLKPKLPVLILSMHPEEQFAIRAFKAGASGYLTKGNPPQELIEALQKVALGKKYISPNLAEVLVEIIGSEAPTLPHDSLSNRELQVLCLIASGKPVSKIAIELALSVKTISTYRTQILRKMNMQSNADLTRYALQNNLI